MPTSVSQHIGVSPSVFEATGAFDSLLEVDSSLFIDPHLLRATSAPELRGSHERLTKYFRAVLLIIKASTREGDVFWKRAASLLTFKEPNGLCTGYSARSTSGSGISGTLTQDILRTAALIVEAGVQEPEIFELVGLFQEGVGSDRISDMVARIILDDLVAYSKRIFDFLGIGKAKTPSADAITELPRNPYNKQPILLMPRDILRTLPVAHTFDDISTVCAHNDALRRKINELIGQDWSQQTRRQRQRLSKRDLRKAVVEAPEFLLELIELYRETPAKPYDFASDPNGELIWQLVSGIEDAHPLNLQLPPTPTADDVLDTVLAICMKFKDLVENNAAYALLYDAQCKKPRHESAAQRLFYCIADSYCAANNLDLTREANAGRGPLDFKVSYGYRAKVVVETKLSTNPKLLHGFRTQLIEYQKAEKTEHSVYLVLDVVGGSSKQIDDLKNAAAEARKSDRRVPEVIIVDAKPKSSASVF